MLISISSQTVSLWQSSEHFPGCRFSGALLKAKNRPEKLLVSPTYYRHSFPQLNSAADCQVLLKCKMFLNMGPKKDKLRESENRVVVTRVWRSGEWGNTGQRAQTSSWKINKLGHVMLQHGDSS